MRIVCIGGGPAGLFFSIVMKTARPDAEILVLERNRADDTFGWGVVFSDQTLGNIAAADPPTYERIAASFVHWDDIDVHFGGRVIRAGGQGFAAIARRKLLRILQERAAEARRRRALRGRRQRRGLCGRRRTGRRGRREQRDAARPRAAFRDDARHAAQPVRLAGHAAAVRCVHVRVRADAARLVPGALLSVRPGSSER